MTSRLGSVVNLKTNVPTSLGQQSNDPTSLDTVPSASKAGSQTGKGGRRSWKPPQVMSPK